MILSLRARYGFQSKNVARFASVRARAIEASFSLKKVLRFVQGYILFLVTPISILLDSRPISYKTTNHFITLGEFVCIKSVIILAAVVCNLRVCN